MDDRCTLRHVALRQTFECDREACVFWRAVDHLDVAPGEHTGCALEYFALLEGGEEVTAWLLSLKERLGRG